MAASSINVIFLKHFVIVHGNGELKEEDRIMFSSFLPVEGTHLIKAKLLKDSGNDFFKQNMFESAGGCYDMACRLLCLVLESKENYDVDVVSQLAISLNLNLAACANKLQEYEMAINLCCLVLSSYPNNAKALFRRTIALMKTNMLLEAQTDLETASMLEPKNKDILRELNVVKNLRTINHNGKRSIDDQLVNEVVRETKRPITDNTGESSVNGGDESSCGSCATPLFDSTVTDTYNDDESSSPNLGFETNHEDSQTGDNMHIQNNSVLEFSRKGGRNSRLRLSAQTYQKILQGGKVSYYNKRDLSTMTIRILNLEATMEGGTTKDHYKRKKKRRKRPNRRKLKTGEKNEDMSISSSLNVNNVIQGISSKESSSDGVNLSVISMVDKDNTALYFQANNNSDEQRTFLFSADPKKCKFSPFDKMPRSSKTHSCCMSMEKRVANFKKKNHIQEDGSPRHNLSTCSTSRSFSSKCLRPRGVSVSCCRYFPEAQLTKKKKEAFTLSATTDRPLKKPFVCDNPNSRLISVSNYVIIMSDSSSRAL